MRNIKLIIEYLGTGLRGWQIQSNAPGLTIQEIIENALSRITGERVRVIGSGRTDAGVHAVAQVAHFKTVTGLRPEKLKHALNALLPSVIAIRDAAEVKPDFHSRFHVKVKTYRYLILNHSERSVFLENRAYFFPYPLDVGLMNREALSLCGRHDFTSFCSNASTVNEATRTVTSIHVKKVATSSLACGCDASNRPLITVDISASGFLYNMARNIVGTLIDIGRGRLAKGSMKKILHAKDRRRAGSTAPAHGLYLLRVRY